MGLISQIIIIRVLVNTVIKPFEVLGHLAHAVQLPWSESLSLRAKSVFPPCMLLTRTERKGLSEVNAARKEQAQLRECE